MANKKQKYGGKTSWADLILTGNHESAGETFISQVDVPTYIGVLNANG
jgi:catalase (peroxidase I)